MTAANTLVDLLAARARAWPERPAFTFVVDGDAEERTWSYRELDTRARAVAVALRARVPAGATVLLVFGQGLDYLAALFGCMYAGVLAVPLQPPGAHRPEQALAKLEAIVADGGVALVATTSDGLEGLRHLFAQRPSLATLGWLATDTVELTDAARWTAPDVGPSSVAYLQYTSGSTSTPKGVMVTHANLLHNLAAFDLDYGHTADSVIVSWLPTFHDLGLVYGVFMSVFGGFRSVLLDPLDFLRRPARWLEAISRHRGTHAPAPNFAFDLCASRVSAAERAALDLTSWRVALNGAEPIRYESEARFVEAFAPCGFRWTTLSHAYGMSEATAVIAKEPVGTEPVFLDVDAAALEQHRVRVVAAGSAGARRIAGCGVAALDTRVRAVDPETRVACASDGVGELWVGGRTVAAGYWRQDAATEEGFRARTLDGEGPYLRTGDLGFVSDGQVFVTGRLKDLVIVRGENHYPQDLEWDVQRAHPAFRPSCVAAFSTQGEGTDGVGVVAEVYPERVVDAEAVFAAVRDALAQHGLAPSVVALARPGALEKTSSGKIMRRRARERLGSGELPLVARWDAPVAPVVRLPELVALETLDVDAREAEVTAWILAAVAERLGVGTDALDPDVALRDLGLDSLGAVELGERLGRAVGVELSTTVLFEHPTAVRLAAHVVGAAGGGAPPRLGTVAPPPVHPPAGALVEDVDEEDLAALIAAELKGI